MNVPKGGRGIKAPYASKVVRVPEPILGQVEKILDSFYSGIDNKSPLDYPIAIDRAREILENNKVGKRSTKYCLEKLLQSIYGELTNL